MLMDEKTKSLLKQKLHFSNEQLEHLDRDPELLSKTLGFLYIIKQSVHRQEARLLALDRLKQIRKELERPVVIADEQLQKARSVYYSFYP